MRLSYLCVCGLLVSAFPLSSVIASPPANVGKAIEAAMTYYENGAYQHDFNQVVKRAQKDLEREYAHFPHPAIVLDIDETTLSNWPEMYANRLGYIVDGPCDHLPSGPCGDKAWMERGEAPSFVSMRSFIKKAQELHVAVFFITGRSEAYRHSIEKNLHREGIFGWTHLFMRPIGNHQPAELYKTPLRAEIEKQGYTILVNVGDQPNDLSGGYTRHRYLLPNPFYTVP